MKGFEELYVYIENCCGGNWPIFSFIGGGGKTTTIMNIAVRLHKRGISTFITTTTKLFKNSDENFQDVELEKYKNREFELLKQDKIPIICSALTDPSDSRKVSGIAPEEVVMLAERMRDKGKPGVILVEADGSKGRSLKAHREYEPQIPQASEHVFAVMGLDSMGMELSEDYVQRSDLFSERFGKKRGEIINPGDYLNALYMPGGYLEAVKAQTSCEVSVILTRRKGYNADISKDLINILADRIGVYLL